ncbi:MAG TPA: tetratricopeptide repeat protein, partial [Thermoanaerobaculia bacterium]|nr:tetratricopeptide repeat protein [Thermoanaerobaculia bacterium]
RFAEYYTSVQRRLHPAPTIFVALAAAAAGACSSGSKSGADWKSQSSYGTTMARKGFWHEALFRYEKAVREKPDDAQLQNNLAVAYESVGETSRALAAYKRALELAPQDPKIKRNYARFAEYYTSVQRASSLPAPTGSAVRPSPSPAPEPGGPGSNEPPLLPPSVGTVPSGESPGTPPPARNPPAPPPAPTPALPGAPPPAPTPAPGGPPSGPR